LWRLYQEWGALGGMLPQGLRGGRQEGQGGKVNNHLGDKGLGPAGNPLGVGMLASALFLWSAWLWARGAQPLINGVWVVGGGGVGIGVVVGVRLLWAIRNSGRLDRD